MRASLSLYHSPLHIFLVLRDVRAKRVVLSVVKALLLQSNSFRVSFYCAAVVRLHLNNKPFGFMHIRLYACMYVCTSAVNLLEIIDDTEHFIDFFASLEDCKIIQTIFTLKLSQFKLCINT